MKVKVWTLGSFFLDYTNISREGGGGRGIREGKGEGKGGGVQKHNLSLCTDLVFANRQTDRQTEKQSDRKTNQQIDVKTDREEVRQTDRGSLSDRH